jgi:hypothetical protein
MYKGKTAIIFLFVIMTLGVAVSLAFNLEGFTQRTNSLENAGKYPESDTYPLLNSYPYTGAKYVSGNGENNVWWHYPIFPVGSYAQITNNLKYQRNPDNGECSRAEFCGALYKDNQEKTNYAEVLPPTPPTSSEETRVNYYNSNKNLFLGHQSNGLPILP